MQFVSDDQRKAVMAKLRGGKGGGGRYGGSGLGNKPRSGSGGGGGYTRVTWYGGGGNYTVQVTDKSGRTTTLNLPAGTSLERWMKKHGIATAGDWRKTKASDIFNLNYGTAVKPAQWVNGIKFLFSGRSGMTSSQYYNAKATARGVNAPTYNKYSSGSFIEKLMGDFTNENDWNVLHP